jgi:diguanylate cyclase (GGDEF)-like protein
MLPTLVPLLSASISGHFEWSADGDKYLASFWSVFTQDQFSNPNLVIVVSQPKSIALAPIKNLITIYVPLLFVAILIVSFISARQIRNKLAPLVTLQDATQRIANGDFSEHINITSDDEFAVLGDAFNVMADHLDSQFNSLSTMAEIDRLILSSFDARFIISTVLDRIGELTSCNMAAVLELDDDGFGEGKLSIRHNAHDTSIDERDVQLSREDIHQLLNNSTHLLFERGSPLPDYLAELPQAASQTFSVFPTFIKEQLSTIVIFGYSHLTKDDEIDWGALRKFVDHVSVALSNAAWEERLYHQAHYDTLTNLPNRALLKDRLEQAIARAQRNQSSIGVFFLDMDHFKLVNDSLGHAAGDIFLRKIADVLKNSIRGVDTVVRFGGDEFVIIIPDIDSSTDMVFELGAIADKIFRNAQAEFVVENQALQPKVSIGIAIYPKDGQASEELIKHADAAMYHAKSKGRARYEFFAPELNTLASHRLKMEQELRRALANEEFLLNYQAKVDCISGELIGAEALIRWRHPERGAIASSEFIAIAEESALIHDIGLWVLKSACLQIARWRNRGLSPLPVAVNVSPRQFSENNFISTVAETLIHAKLAPSMLELEITETTVMVDFEESIKKLKAIREMGLRLSMDDFGTGYSSLSYLRRLPIHTLKIDRSFVMALSDEDETQAIVSATIILAHKLGLKVVAEGVETEEQRRLLQGMQCDTLQGYLISKPLPADQFAELFLQKASGEPDLQSKLQSAG